MTFKASAATAPSGTGERPLTGGTPRYAQLGIGPADASLVALAARLGTPAIVTFDVRHFRAVRPLAGGDAFTLLPVDVG